jgi:DNA-binding transcriptional ArsR family regulator
MAKIPRQKKIGTGGETDPSVMFKVLSAPSRIRIITLLKSAGPLGTNGIAKRLGLTPAAVSQHLKTLRQAGLVQSERKGYWIPYSVDQEAMECCRHVLDDVCTCGCPRTKLTRGKGPKQTGMALLKELARELEHELKAVRELIRKRSKATG